MLLFTMKKLIIAHAIILSLLIGAVSYAYARYWNIATVNGTPISRISYIKLLEQQGGQQILAQMIDDALILNEGKNKNVTIDQKTIDEEIAKVEARLKAQGQELDAALAANKMTRASLEYQIRLKKIQDNLAASKVEVTQAQIDDFLKANKAMLPTGKSKDELIALAKQQLVSEADQASASAWLDKLRSDAKIVYK